MVSTGERYVSTVRKKQAGYYFQIKKGGKINQIHLEKTGSNKTGGFRQATEWGHGFLLARIRDAEHFQTADRHVNENVKKRRAK